MGVRSAAGLAGLLALLLAGCSGSPFGERLSRSFSGSPQPRSSGAAPTSTAGLSVQASGAKPPVRSAPPAAPEPATPAPPTAAPPSQLNPAPYRVTIKLPAADPSAPAERVTEALRRAGVPFEVEMIERVNGAPPAAPALPTPAPAPRAR